MKSSWLDRDNRIESGIRGDISYTTYWQVKRGSGPDTLFCSISREMYELIRDSTEYEVDLVVDLVLYDFRNHLYYYFDEI